MNRIAGSLFAAGIACAALAEPVKVYPYLMNPREHPDDARRWVKPPDAGTFQNRLQFIALRRMGADYKESLDRYVTRDRLGDIVWPHYEMLFLPNLAEKVQELKQRGLYLFDLWGFVPGPGSDFGCGQEAWRQFYAPDGVYEMFERELGPRWLGMDNGEQDGRYIGRFAHEFEPYGADRFHQYLNFQRHFERMGDILGNKMATLVSLNYGHYFLREGVYTMIGAETAQALPNAQVYYSFIRGAGKQYGVPWFGNVSVFNRWGWKAYPEKEEPGQDFGPTKGTSLSLMKRLMMAQIFYDSVAVGFENGYYKGDTLTPIGKIQQAARAWSERYGAPGVLHTPVAVMTDFFAGWTFPRHLYSGEIYRVWGGLPYDEGDYLTDGVLGLLYPRYEDASYFQDEGGFSVPTPFGDCADVLLSDAPLWILRQYPVLVLAGRVSPSKELADTLRAYAEGGGHLVFTSGNGFLPFAVGDTAVGKGRVTRFASPFGIAAGPQGPTAQKELVNKPLIHPFPLLPEVRERLAEIFRSQMIFRVSDKPGGGGLAFVTCRRSPGEYTLLVSNCTWQEKPFAIQAVSGAIKKIEELPMDSSEKTAVGYFPGPVANAVLGADTPATIAAGAVRMFRVAMDEAGAVEELPKAVPPKNPTGRCLFIREEGSLKEAILRRPTFFRHYDSAAVDWRWLHARDIAGLREEAGWFRRQGLRILVDVSSGINLFPDIRLVDNDTREKARSEALLNDVLEKMAALGAKDLAITRHQNLEQNMNAEQVKAGTAKNLKALCQKAAERGVTVHLRQSVLKSFPSGGFPAWLAAVGEPNLKAAPSLGVMCSETADPAELCKRIETFGTDLVFVAGASRDSYGQVSSLHVPLARQTAARDLSPVLALLRAKGFRLVFDGIYDSLDDEYEDARLLE